MRRVLGCTIMICLFAGVAFQSTADEKTVLKDGGKGTDAKKAAAVASKDGDTLVVVARLVEIPGTFPPNDLYNYVYVMKYRVLKVEKGVFEGKEILVGHYNPLIVRSQIKDKMDKYVDGDVKEFIEGAKHRLTLIAPLDKVWQEAMEDEYFDSAQTKYYALKTDVAK